MKTSNSQPPKAPVAWPRWEVATEYPPPDLPLEGWAWEFLRRNQDYQNQWKYYVERTAELTQKLGPQSRWGKDVVSGTEAWFFDPPVKSSETQSTWRTRVVASGLEPMGPLQLREGLALEWRLEEMFNPAFSWLHVADMDFRPRFRARAAPRIRYFVGDIDYWAGETSRAMWPLPVAQGSALVEIDLGSPIESQLERILPALEKKRDELIAQDLVHPDPKKGPKTDAYPGLLRVYDAYVAKRRPGAKFGMDHIANVIYGKGRGTLDALEKRYEAAAILVRGKGYLRLLP